MTGPLALDTGDAFEIVELLRFVADLCASAPGPMDLALEDFAGPGYAALDLRQSAISLAGRLAFALAGSLPAPESAP